ncbi:MAG: hypothetical protein RMM53_09810 [Bacteroidia bacterium]|nr:hypothetical protein [Bacteroidia bacterium]
MSEIRIRVGTVRKALEVVATILATGCLPHSSPPETAVILWPGTPVVAEGGRTTAILTAGQSVELLGEYSTGLHVRLEDGTTGFVERKRAAARAWPAAVIAPLTLDDGKKIFPPAILAVVGENGDELSFVYAPNERETA